MVVENILTRESHFGSKNPEIFVQEDDFVVKDEILA